MHARGVWQDTLTVLYNVGLIIKNMPDDELTNIYVFVCDIKIAGCGRKRRSWILGKRSAIRIASRCLRRRRRRGARVR